MNASAEPSWTQAEQIDPISQLSSVDLDDLGNLFEFGDIDLTNIPSADTSSFNDHVQTTQPPSHPTTPFQELHNPTSMGATATHDFGSQMPFTLPPQLDYIPSQRPQYLSRENSQSQFPTDMYQAAVRQPYPNTSQPHHFSYQAQLSYPTGHHVPPTPTSFDMHGMQHPQQLDPQQRAILEQRFHLRKDDVTAFTPMVSPAGTPQFNVPSEFTTPGAYFSPLTSPMLHAQNGATHHLQGYYTNPSTNASSNATSPADLSTDVDMLGDDVVLPEAGHMHIRRPRRKPAAPRSVTSVRAEQSPVQKAQKRKSSAMLAKVPTINAEGLAHDAQRLNKLTPTSAGSHGRVTFGSSDDGSISPEPLSEALMGPPPRPGSGVTQSPALSAQAQTGDASGDAAATPKSILSQKGMQPPGSTASVGANALRELALDDLELPEAANPGAAKPSLAQLDTQMSSTADDSTPRFSARKTPKLGPTSTPTSARPNSARPLSASNSPLVGGMMMPGTTPTGILRDKTHMKGGRPVKKRGSLSTTGSTLLSPALRPRISPSIKPLLPEGTTLHSPTHALLLASKSNYQNLLEGNHLPGVNYPDSLSTGLTSKRTSHKVAEQGRRNRINEALKEMQSLLPKTAASKQSKESAGTDSSPGADDVADADGKDGKTDAAKSNSSKAATVESANEYIRKLQKENADLQKEFAEIKRRMGTSDETGKQKGNESVAEAQPVPKEGVVANDADIGT